MALAVELPRQAQAMISRAIEAGVPFAWFTADEAYGQAKYLQVWLETRTSSMWWPSGAATR